MWAGHTGRDCWVNVCEWVAILCGMTMIEINGFMAVALVSWLEINQNMFEVTYYDCEIDAAI